MDEIVATEGVSVADPFAVIGLRSLEVGVPDYGPSGVEADHTCPVEWASDHGLLEGSPADRS